MDGWAESCEMRWNNILLKTPCHKFPFILINIQEEVIPTLFLFHIFHRLFFIDTRSIIIFIPAKCYIQKSQKPIHTFQKRLRSAKTPSVMKIHKIFLLKYEALKCFNKKTNDCAKADFDGVPSKTITRSARYVAIKKSCSTMNAVFFACNMNLSSKIEIVV